MRISDRNHVIVGMLKNLSDCRGNTVQGVMAEFVGYHFDAGEDVICDWESSGWLACLVRGKKIRDGGLS